MITNINLQDFEIVQTKDGYFRFVNHTKRLLTTGFKERKHLIKYESNIRFDEGTIKIMSERYNKEL